MVLIPTPPESVIVGVNTFTPVRWFTTKNSTVVTPVAPYVEGNALRLYL